MSRDPGFFADDIAKRRAAERHLGLELALVLGKLCQDSGVLTGNHRDLAEYWNCGVKWLELRLVKLEQADVIRWVRPTNQYAEGSITITASGGSAGS